jgi:hypothetical protein
MTTQESTPSQAEGLQRVVFALEATALAGGLFTISRRLVLQPYLDALATHQSFEVRPLRKRRPARSLGNNGHVIFFCDDVHARAASSMGSASSGCVAASPTQAV